MEALIDEIYEAAFVPGLWPRVLDRMADLSDSVSGALLIYPDGGAPRWTCTDLIAEVLADYCTGDAWKQSEITSYMVDIPPASFFYDEDYFPREMLARDLMRQPLRELGIGNQIGGFFFMPTNENLCITFERPVGAPRPDGKLMKALHGLRPHLARAALMAARLGLERARDTVETLRALEIPAAVIGRQGRVLAVNILFEGLDGIVRPAAFGRLALADRAADALFRQSIEVLYGSRDEPGAIRSIPVKPGDDGTAPMVVHMLPLRRRAHEVFSGGDLLVAVTPLSRAGMAPPPMLLSGLFDLMPVEARLAATLARGQTLQAFATEQAISINTARYYLRGVMAKTGVHQQSELVALLKSAWFPSE